MYLPREWTDDAARCRKAGVPSEVGFATKPQLAWQQIEAALQAGYPLGTVLADAAYGDETAWREKLAGRGLTYAVGVVWRLRSGGANINLHRPIGSEAR
jgi:SRSO17 transposase